MYCLFKTGRFHCRVVPIFDMVFGCCIKDFKYSSYCDEESLVRLDHDKL